MASDPSAHGAAADTATSPACRGVPDVPPAADVPTLWRDVVAMADRRLREAGLERRDAIVLVPFAALLAPARQAWAALGGWMPRIETVATLAAALGPPAGPGLGRDPVADRLRARALLRGQSWAVDWGRRSEVPLDHLAGLLADAAGELAAAAALEPPAQRAAWWARARAVAADGMAPAAPGAMEAALRRIAVEWAASEGAATEAAVPAEPVFELHPAAWVIVTLGGEDRAALRLVAASAAPVVHVRADPPASAPFATLDAARLPTRWLCDDEEDEAWLAADQVLEALQAGRLPVAVVTLDRAVARRIRAHLDRAGVAVADETGWRLSASASAARVMALLQAAEAPAGAARQDAVLSWLKCTHDGQGEGLQAPAWLSALEARWRGLRVMGGETVRAEAEAREHAALQALALLPARGSAPLSTWIQRLMQADAAGGPQADDDAVRRALKIDDRDPDWAELGASVTLTLTEFRSWVDLALESAVMEPSRPPDAVVVFTPLSRAVGRAFAQVIVPGADGRQLGGVTGPPGLWSDAQRRALGLDDRDTDRQRQRLALAQLLRNPAVSLIRRREDLAGPCSASPWITWMAGEAQSRGLVLPEVVAWTRPKDERAAAPVRPPLPTAPEHLPAALSASRVEALRNCPYQFFVRSALGLKDPEELDDAADKRDYGTWLHAALETFHKEGLDDASASFDVTVDRLRQAAARAAEALALEPAALLAFAASAEAFWPAYVDWWRSRQAAGWRFEAGEWSVTAASAPLAPARLTGQIDRVDVHRDGRVAVIDFKTGAVDGLRRKVKDPLEDTQLVFYAALLRAERPQAGPIEALYLALDDADAPVEVPHPSMEDHVGPVLDGLAADLQALRAGAPLPALGQSVVCERCEARGLCRRDHWVEPAQPVAPVPGRAP